MTLKLSTIACATLLAAPAGAAELVYGNWTPAQEYQNRVAMPDVIKMIDAETKGAIKWKLVPGSQLADAKATFTAVKDGLMHAGLGIVTYVPNAIPSVYAIYSTLIFGENDPVAATLAALETMYFHCPSCTEEAKKNNAVLLGGWVSSSYVLACSMPIKTLAELKGKRVRATGGNADMLKQAGMVPVGATLVEAVGLLQRGGLDCQHGVVDWLRTFGYADVAKYVMDYPLGMSGPAIGFLMNRDTWNGFTPEQKKAHAKAAAWLTAKMAIGNFIVSNEASLDMIKKDKGVQVVAVGKEFDPIPAQFRTAQRETNIATAKNFGVKDPAAIIDTYEKAVDKWRAKSKEIGRDIDKFAAVIEEEIFAKVDLGKI